MYITTLTVSNTANDVWWKILKIWDKVQCNVILSDTVKERILDIFTWKILWIETSVWVSDLRVKKYNGEVVDFQIWPQSLREVFKR